jgi:hypothetical protein
MIQDCLVNATSSTAILPVNGPPRRSDTDNGGLLKACGGDFVPLA